MTVAIVDLLEVIDVDHQASERGRLALAARELLVQTRLQVTSVVPTREHIREPAADQPRAVHRVLEGERGDHGEVMEEIRREVLARNGGSRRCPD